MLFLFLVLWHSIPFLCFLGMKTAKSALFITFNIFAKFLFICFTVHHQIYSFHFTLKLHNFVTFYRLEFKNEQDSLRNYLDTDFMTIVGCFSFQRMLESFLCFTANRFVENIGKVRFIFCSLTKFTVET